MSILDQSVRKIAKYTNLHLVNLGSGTVLYAPLVGIVIEVTDGVAEQIERIFSGSAIADFPGGNDWTEFLDDLSKASTDRCDVVEQSPVSSRSFAPTEVTLSLTANCNLKCVYCYIHGGERDHNMNSEIAEASIDFVAKNAVRRNRGSFAVTFHGEGEPTFNWSQFKQTVTYAERVAQESNLKLILSMTSNGMWSKSQFQFITARFNSISLSIDGLQADQDMLRPTRSGKSSFETVSRNLIALGKSKTQCGVRATITPLNVDRIVPFLDFLVTKAAVKGVRLEPIFDAGRAMALPGEERDSRAFEKLFAQRFFEARQYGKAIGIDVDYSGCSDVSPHGKFCGATGTDPNFVVMTSGLVSSCYEVNKRSHPLGEFFVYGYYNAEARSFRFLENKLDRLMNFDTKDGSPCASCFAQSNCSGDCLARYELKSLIDGGTSSRCGLNKQLNRAIIADTVGRSVTL
ncbi:radical SAM protein [Neorhizobium galegae]|uniref:radical SAM protein n=1 Tax=Neorhizobium galegae TaxID=399 RepID=UPI00127C9EA3|nr:radical SAM protein [Neorhizobium galegae]KAA9387733.1 radical SAM protein [Neorhizobium galegae]MCM2501964.1 radical SAM protein [Neorhizobium galegae]MCQ1774325.1 radical SAM protein [Neorhizobium galegae]MCQ1799965.1 radical SAM protein [Neorhizobium galegae]